eukprot:TRINITY_DN6239_c0_g1_i1.p1 TRINITY_DN6239_c0_g1~~TRINITY_DN6239_c0_g1_i1.p1  ORF type:complete len:463 (-),score=42.21 TRINITY_DN6239_c0_g1_i1:22-1410(-)
MSEKIGRKRKQNTKTNETNNDKIETTHDWGRMSSKDNLTSVLTLLLFLTTPLMVFYHIVAIRDYRGSLTTPFLEIFEGSSTFGKLWNQFPSFSLEAVKIYFTWYIFQVILDRTVPGKTGYGQETPGGNILPYRVNGLNVWIVSHVVYLLCVWMGLFKGSIIYDHFPELALVASTWGYILATFAYIKACFFPTHPEDCKWSGSLIYDYFMGVEMNPRIGGFDFKLFHNGRPGIVAWTLINISYAFKQYELYGYITNSIIIVNILHATYVLDFFYNEDWYLRTIDIAHDHFGWYLAWGDSVWLPVMYTLQGHYLVVNPVQLPTWTAIGILSFGALGYAIFRGCNHQKDLVRNTKGNCTIWGKKPTYITTKFKTGDGKIRTSILLTSGFWGLSRHFNYVGDLIISLAYCLACGFEHLLPYFYIIYMTCLLVHRTWRDEHRCSAKYGKYWSKYCQNVRWRILPYVF